ncbi:MAG: PilN domain-containing protein [Gemmatimonadetes bacterium]|nr:PilN domain-containing protein [Gemmatimonadota bacterium]
MIEINLLPGQKRKKRAAAGLAMPDFKALLAQVKDPLLLGAVGAWAAVLVVVGFIYVTEGRKLAAMQQDLSRVEADARRFEALINQKRKEERLRDSLVAELDAIRAIDSDRYVWPHILEEITKALPDFTWLESVAVVPSGGGAAGADSLAKPAVQVLLDGRTGDMGGYTRFLRQLGESPWLTNVVAGATKTVVEKERPVLSFTISVTFRQADSAFIRTAPVLESVR